MQTPLKVCKWYLLLCLGLSVNTSPILNNSQKTESEYQQNGSSFYHESTFSGHPSYENTEIKSHYKQDLPVGQSLQSVSGVTTTFRDQNGNLVPKVKKEIINNENGDSSRAFEFKEDKRLPNEYSKSFNIEYSSSSVVGLQPTTFVQTNLNVVGSYKSKKLTHGESGSFGQTSQNIQGSLAIYGADYYDYDGYDDYDDYITVSDEQGTTSETTTQETNFYIIKTATTFPFNYKTNILEEPLSWEEDEDTKQKNGIEKDWSHTDVQLQTDEATLKNEISTTKNNKEEQNYYFNNSSPPFDDDSPAYETTSDNISVVNTKPSEGYNTSTEKDLKKYINGVDYEKYTISDEQGTISQTTFYIIKLATQFPSSYKTNILEETLSSEEDKDTKQKNGVEKVWYTEVQLQTDEAILKNEISTTKNSKEEQNYYFHNSSPPF